MAPMHKQIAIDVIIRKAEQAYDMNTGEVPVAKLFGEQGDDSVLRRAFRLADGVHTSALALEVSSP